MKNTINFVLLLDESGSMSYLRDTTIKGADDVVNTIRSECKKYKLDATFSFSTFDDSVKSHLNLEKVPTESIGKYYQPNGGTNICGAILNTLQGFKPEGRVCFILFTDGQDGSRDQDDVKSVISKCSDQYTFVYVGPGHIEDSAKSMGIKSWATYETTAAGTRAAFSKIARAVKNYIARAAENFDADLTEGFFTDIEKKTTMTVNGLSCIINTPVALKSKKKKNDEEAHALPPYDPIDAYVVDEYPACPSTWMHGSAKASSYFVAVEEDRGMWIDLNAAVANSDYHIAAVISVQGVNPVSGQKTSELDLQQFKTKCPVHNADFQQDRFCPECKFKWPAQNYLSSNVTPDGYFWLDGFRSEDGKVRQYIFTEEEAKGVAANVIGKDRVYAIGIAFYRSKAKKPKPQFDDLDSNCRGITRSMTKGVYGNSGFPSGKLMSYMAPASSAKRFTSSTLGETKTSGRVHTNSLRSKSYESYEVGCCADGYAGSPAPAAEEMPIGSSEVSFDTAALSFESSDLKAASAVQEVKVEKSYEVGAGATIDQQVHPDTESIEYWESEPFGMIYVNYADPKTVKKIVAAGKRVDKKDGFLAGVPVGH